MSIKKIRIECTYDDLIDVDVLYNIQGDLKKPFDLETLKKSILKNNIKFPLFVWQDEDIYKIIDGAQRTIVYHELKEEGYVFKVPIVYIGCENHQKAKESLLRGAARYAKLSKDGFIDFVRETGLDLEGLEDELSHKTYKFLPDIIRNPLGLKDVQITGSKGNSDETIQLTGVGDSFVLYQLIFKNKDIHDHFWKLITKLRNNSYKNKDYRDILYSVLEQEVNKGVT